MFCHHRLAASLAAAVGTKPLLLGARSSASAASFFCSLSGPSSCASFYRSCSGASLSIQQAAACSTFLNASKPRSLIAGILSSIDRQHYARTYSQRPRQHLQQQHQHFAGKVVPRRPNPQLLPQMAVVEPAPAKVGNPITDQLLEKEAKKNEQRKHSSSSSSSSSWLFSGMRLQTVYAVWILAVIQLTFFSVKRITDSMPHNSNREWRLRKDNVWEALLLLFVSKDAHQVLINLGILASACFVLPKGKGWQTLGVYVFGSLAVMNIGLWEKKSNIRDERLKTVGLDVNAFRNKMGSLSKDGVRLSEDECLDIIYFDHLEKEREAGKVGLEAAIKSRTLDRLDNVGLAVNAASGTWNVGGMAVCYFALMAILLVVSKRKPRITAWNTAGAVSTAGIMGYDFQTAGRQIEEAETMAERFEAEGLIDQRNQRLWSAAISVTYILSLL